EVGVGATAESGPLEESDGAQVDVLGAQTSFASNGGSDAPPLLLKAARRLEPQDTRLARDCYLDALAAGVFAGRLAKGSSVEEVAEAARTVYPSSRPSRPQDLLLDGLSLVITEGRAAGATLLRQALAAFRGEDISMEEGLRWLWIACHAAGLLWVYDSWDVLSARLVQLARDAGARSALPIGLSTRAGVHIFSGELNMAASLVEEVATVTQATRSSIAPYGALGLAAFRGLETEASELIEAGTREVLRRGEGEGLTFVQWATAVLFNGLGRYEDARAAAEQAGEDSRVVWFSTWGLVELIEAASRTEKIELASDALDRLAETTAASGTDWARGIENRSRALL